MTVTVRLTDQAIQPLDTLDPAAPPADFGWLDQAIGAARVVAIGESAHYNRETGQLRHRVTRYLVERHGFTAYATESGFTEGWLVDDWVRGGPDQLDRVMANGMTSLMGLWTEVRAQLSWLRQHNRTAEHPVGHYGIDMPGSMASLLPGVDAVIAYLAVADPEFAVPPDVRSTAAAFAVPSAFSAPESISAYRRLDQAGKDALTAGLADLTARMTGRRFDYVARTSMATYQRALQSLSTTVTLDAMLRALSRGDQRGMMLGRDATMADTVEWILRREHRIVVAAHNGHVQRWPGRPGVATMGMHLADRLSEDYVVIGTTSGAGQTLNTAADFYGGTLFTELSPPRPGSLDALMAASHDGPFATDLRRLSPVDTATVATVTEQRYGTSYAELDPLAAYDVVVHLPRVTGAESDGRALRQAPTEVRTAFDGRSATNCR
jgi:erythromycin esterase